MDFVDIYPLIESLSGEWVNERAHTFLVSNSSCWVDRPVRGRHRQHFALGSGAGAFAT